MLLYLYRVQRSEGEGNSCWLLVAGCWLGAGVVRVFGGWRPEGRGHGQRQKQIPCGNDRKKGKGKGKRKGRGRGKGRERVEFGIKGGAGRWFGAGFGPGGSGRDQPRLDSLAR